VEWVLSLIQKYKYEPTPKTYRFAMLAYSDVRKKEERAAEILWDAKEMVGAAGRFRRAKDSGFGFKV
jgi:hypothetical protein